MDILKPVDPEELKLIESEPYEQRDLSVRAMTQFLVLIFATIIGSVIISYFVFAWVVNVPEPEVRSVRKESRARQLPPEPRVQGFPMRDWESFYREEIRKTTTYGWQDQAMTRARIPVERAKEIILEKGLSQ